MIHLSCKHCGSDVELFGDVESITSVECEACETHTCVCGSTKHEVKSNEDHQKIMCSECNRILAIEANIFNLSFSQAFPHRV